jgi:hypothetical protein
MSNDIYCYYVYAYLRQQDSKTAKAGTPYYIGKGKNGRAYAKHRHIPIPKKKTKIVFLETNLSNIGALALERRYIDWYGRKDLGTGILHNRTSGGEGSTNFCHSLESIAKIRTSKMGKNNPNYGKKLSLEIRKKMSSSRKGKRRSPETIAKISTNKLGKKHTEEAKAKMSISHLGKQPWNKGKKLKNKSKICKHCKRQFSTKTSRPKQRFCSSSCFATEREKNRKMKDIYLSSSSFFPIYSS